MTFSIRNHLAAFGIGIALAVVGLLLYLQFGGAAGPFGLTSAAAPDSLPTVRVYKTPTCNCCAKWVDHMKEEGFEVRTNNLNSLSNVKKQAGIPDGLSACHTAVVGRYVVEGHVPAEDVKRLLATRPDVRGIAVPGMPIGSPGMERGSRQEPYNVVAFDTNGGTSVFAEHNQ
jgi:hypothetical protein